MAKVSPVHSDGESDDERAQKDRAAKKSKVDDKVDEQPMDVDEDQGGEEEGNGEEEEYEIEEILDAKRGSFPNGRMGYFVKWKGYDASENSWVDEQDAGNAEALIEEFWKKHPKKARKSLDAKTPKKPRKSVTSEDIDESASTATKKRGRKSQGAKESISEDRASKKAKKNGATENDDSHPLEDEVVVGDMSAYMTVQSWEHLVDTIDTIERAPDSSLRVYFTLKTGDRIVEDSKLCSQRFPQKLIEFYEGNLRWKSAGPDEDES